MDWQSLDDQSLVKKALAGDSKAFSILVRRYQDTVFSIALSFVYDFEEAHDVSQEVFIKAFEQLRKLDQPALFGNWLRIIAANHARSLLRKSPKPLVRLSQLSEAEIPYTDFKEEPARCQEDLSAIALHALKGLDETNRQIIALYYLGNRRVEEVARLRDCFKTPRTYGFEQLERSAQAAESQEIRPYSFAITINQIITIRVC